MKGEKGHGAYSNLDHIAYYEQQREVRYRPWLPKRKQRRQTRRRSRAR